MSLVVIFMVLNIIISTKTENLEGKEEIHENFDDYITFEHGINMAEEKTKSTENDKVLAIFKNDADDSAKIENIIPSLKIKRSAVEEIEASPKPIRRVRHRGNLKQDLKAGEVNTSAQSDLRNEEVTKSIKSNTNTFEDTDDNATNKTNIALNNNLISTYLDINRDLLMRTIELNRLANRNATPLNNQSISSVVQNENMKSKGIIEMPSKYITVVKDSNENVNQNLLNAKRLYGHIENKEINDAGFVLEQNNGYLNQRNVYQTLSREKQGKYHEYSVEGDDYYNKDMKQPNNMKTLGANGRNVRHFNGARPRFNDRQLMGRSGAGFDEEEYYEDYSDYTYQKLRQGKVDDYQGMMEDSGTTFEAVHYEGYQNQPNSHQKLHRARQGHNRHELVEDIDRDRLRTYQNHPNGIDQKLFGVSQIYNHKEPMEVDDTRILTEPHYEGPYETFERNAHVRPKFEQELLERDRNSGLMGEQYRKGDSHHPSHDHISQKLLEPRPRFDQKELVERNDARIQPLASPTVTSHTQDYDIRLDHQVLMESNGHANIEDHYIREKLNHPNMNYFDTNGHNIHEKLLETRPRFDHIEPIAASDKIEEEQYEKLTEVKPMFDHQDFKESKNNEMLNIETGNPNILVTKGSQHKQNLVKNHSEKFLHQFEETNGKIPIPNPINNEPVFEDLRKPTQEATERKTADIVAEQYNEDFPTPNIKAQDINPNIHQNMLETATLGLDNMAIKEADTRYYAEPEYTDEPNVIPFENTNTHPASFKERNAYHTTVDDIPKLIHLDDKERSVGIYPRLIQVPRIQSLVVLPRFRCRLVPVCTRFYLRKRCLKTIIKCGLL
ncbi:uncharacterized protein LOC121738046 [Aricia agestis]|uniref:uncharacterized protein LOC121738046 n=1 Tax=Aricia agestis TaxID=91739 RepID=UPI001C208221|nr:uncharacterized protein LOC121738046 [Aricia agestis]